MENLKLISVVEISDKCVKFEAKNTYSNKKEIVKVDPFYIAYYAQMEGEIVRISEEWDMVLLAKKGIETLPNWINSRKDEQLIRWAEQSL